MPDWMFFVDDIKQVCTDYCLRYWEVVGIWLTGIATSSAVIVSLMFSRRDRPNIKVSAGIRIMVGGDEVTHEHIEDYPEYLAVTIRNVGNRPVKIEGIGWRKLWPFKLAGYQSIQPQPGGVTLPYMLPDGDSVSIYTSLDDPEIDWLPNFAENFLGRWPRLGVRFLRVTAWTPTSKTFNGHLEKSFRDRLIDEAKRLRENTAPP